MNAKVAADALVSSDDQAAQMKRKTSGPLRAAIYARCSTEEQNTGLQLRELGALAERRGWTPLEPYVDVISGAKDSRPALDMLLADVRTGKVDVVAVWALDRLGRSLRHLLSLSSEFEARGVDLVVATQPIDTTTPAGRLVYAVLGAVAEFERSMIAMRVKAGIARRKAAGKPVGRQRRATRAQVERIVELRREGRSWRKISMAVGLPLTTVRDSHREACRAGGAC
jgi:DNA invertase Pin-like site-specific DNA recombinase